MTDIKINPASFKDPAGFVFERNATIYRHVHTSYAKQYDQLLQSGLYALLTEKRWLIRHTEVNENISKLPGFYKTLLPEQLPFISYPYEWSFDMLKDAALLTLQVCREAIGHGMILKDATAYNIQFFQGRPVFIDTLSFETYHSTTPWVAYRQFCEMFLAPLLLSHYTHADLSKLLLAYPEGIPVEICSRLLPLRSRFSLLSLLHIHLQTNVKGSATAPSNNSFSQQKLLNVLDHLLKGLTRLQAGTARTTWSDYYENTVKSQDYVAEKQAAFSLLLDKIQAETAIDMGANNGLFSKMMADKNLQVVACDYDGHAINVLYRELKNKPCANLLPLVIDLVNPSPAIGWSNTERTAFLQRRQYDLVVALALVHHLAIGKNISFRQVAACFHAVCQRFLVIEWIEKEDEKVLLLLQRKQLSYDWYTKAAFEKEFSALFDLVNHLPLSNGRRTIYLWTRK